ncbi:MAG: hypothetical protein A3H49_11195 [Nitrospirae bacterium RIFCSPLOWO2_02_FULL_62_14]|nr:MAG: hypothetical protein A3H49_11195 [Nitrospirae bacterium RIFCSPLOWO2_02_FULL_62_14]OGW70313.1 MAG: hypothetical protein A3A88_04370 [Nitrospirae bacterium RIFCSPLOWO2_01_FULL_62_17]
MGKMLVSVFFGLMMVMVGATAALALQAGGVEIGDLETGSVVGIPFKDLDVDADLVAIEIANGKVKTWYPPTTVVDFKVRPGRPFLLKVTNQSEGEHGFFFTAEENASAPTVLKAKIVLKPGETKYIGIPTSDLFYATHGNVLYYKCHLHPAHIGGRLLMIK